MRHASLVLISYLTPKVLGYPKKKMLTKFKEVVLSELLNFIRSLDLVRIATRLNRKRIYDPKVPKYTQTRTVTLVPLIAEFAVVVGEVG